MLPAADLTTAELLAGSHTAPIDNAAFAMPSDADQPSSGLEGRLELLGLKAPYFRGHRDDFDRQADNRINVLPPLELEVVTMGNDLVPRNQGLRYSGARWNYVVTPGHVWHDDRDGEWNRVSLPFGLAERDQNCTHNGVLSFLYKAGAAGVEVSATAFQITQETCLYFKFDSAGSAETKYLEAPITERETILARHQQWLAQRLPVEPISQLTRDYPTAQISTPAFGAGMIKEHLTTFGVVYGGVHYRGASETRYGEYPFPELEVLPSYSVAKTVFTGATLMALAQEDGPTAGRQLLRDHLPKVRKKRLEGVTFEHALDMATGHYRDPGEQVDERDNYTELNFFLGESRNQKLLAALSYPTQEAPGQRWVYHTTDTFLLVNAIGSYLEQKGRTPDAHRWLVENLYAPLGLSPVARITMRTGSSEKGAPFGGFGLHFLPDDLARLAKLFNVDHGRVAGRQILEPSMLAAALQQDPTDRGLEALFRGEKVFYNNAVWASEETFRVGNAARPMTVWLPRMLGFGGIAVILLPNGATYYYVGDHDQHSWLEAVRELLALPASSGNARAN